MFRWGGAKWLFLDGLQQVFNTFSTGTSMPSLFAVSLDF
jgi:hypothetical protein